jgi:hypothetical protein
MRISSAPPTGVQGERSTGRWALPFVWLAALVCIGLDCVPGFLLIEQLHDEGDPFHFVTIIWFWGTIICLAGALLSGALAMIGKGPRLQTPQCLAKTGTILALVWPIVIVGILWGRDLTRQARQRTLLENQTAEAALSNDQALIESMQQFAYRWNDARIRGEPLPRPTDPRLVYLGDGLTRANLDEDALSRLVLAYTVELPKTRDCLVLCAFSSVFVKPPEGLRDVRLRDAATRRALGLPPVARYWPDSREQP